MQECAECGAEAFRGERCVVHFLMGERGADGRYHHLNWRLTGLRLKDVTITDVTFEGETHFDRCEFAGEVRFENCAFTGYVSFIEATAERLAFRECRFTHIVNLADTEFGDLSIHRSEFEAPVELKLGPGTVDIHLTTFAGRSGLVGDPQELELRRVVFRSGAQLQLDGTGVDLDDVEFGAPSSLGSSSPHWASSRPRLLGVAGTDLSRLSVFYTDLSRCSFTYAHNLEGFSVESLEAFACTPPGMYARRYVLWDEARLRIWAGTGRRARRWRSFFFYTDNAITLPAEPIIIARDYRALRRAREDAKDEPGAADFYYGEMEMRRMARRYDLGVVASSWGERIAAGTEYLLLWLYWLVSGYGLRAWRALTALVVVLLGASVIFRYAGFPGNTHTYAASLRFAIQSAMSLVRGTDETLTPIGEWVTLALRLLGPLLFGLALLALRGRVRR